MKKMEMKQLEKVYGGGISLGTGLLIAAGIVFIIGVVDGFFRPLRCNK